MMYKKTQRLIKLAILPIAIGLSLSATANEADNASVELTPCYVKGLEDRMMCGKVTRPLSDNDQDGQIDVHFAVIPAIKASYPNEAVLAFAGGPGQSAIELAGHFDRHLSRVREKRDIILVDQRGTGKSQKLQCESDDLTTSYGFNDEIVDIMQLNAKQVKQCQQTLDVDLSHFTTPVAAKDFEAVRQALGYMGLHLYGISYGTRIAQEYMRQFPESVITSTLDGVTPMQQSLMAIGHSIDASLNALFERCEKDANCATEFPNLQQQFNTLVAQLEQEPVQTAIKHPRTFETIDLVVTKSKFYSAIRMALYSHATRAMVPLAIKQASNGDYATLSGLMSGTDLQGTMAMGMHNAIVCGEDWPKLTTQDRQDFSRSYFGKMMIQGLDTICPILKVDAVSSDFYQPLKTDIPTLLLSGQRDPATPPSWAEMAMVNMTNATHLVSPTATHGVVAQTCGKKIVAEFVDKQSMKDVATECIEQSNDKHFFMNINGVAVKTRPQTMASNKE